MILPTLNSKFSHTSYFLVIKILKSVIHSSTFVIKLAKYLHITIHSNNFVKPSCIERDIVVTTSVGVCGCVVLLFGFVQAITCTVMHGFLNNVVQFLSLRSRSAFETFIQVGCKSRSHLKVK